MKFKLDQWQRDMNKNIYAGLAGGLLVLFSQLGIEEAIRKSLLPNTFISKVFGVFILSLILFFIMAITSVFLKGNKKQK